MFAYTLYIVNNIEQNNIFTLIPKKQKNCFRHQNGWHKETDIEKSF